MHIKFVVIGIALISQAAFGQAKEIIDVYEYHNQPPFIIDANLKQGFSYDVVRLLNEQSSEFEFQLAILPKKRVALKLHQWIDGKCSATSNCPKNWFALWTTPQWGWGENPQQNYLWLPIFNDGDVVVTQKRLNINYLEPNSLEGYRLGGLIGHKYHGVDELVAQGKIFRDDSSTEETLLLRVIRDRVDAIILQKSAIDYLFNSKLYKGKESEVTISQNLFQPFVAQAMIPTNNPAIFDELNLLLLSPKWQNLLNQYNLSLPSKQ